MDSSFRLTPAALLAAAVLVGCASGGSSATSTAAQPEAAPRQQSTLPAPAGAIEWRGSFHSALQTSADIGASGSRNNVTGSVRLTRVADGTSHVEITLSTNASEMRNSHGLSWVVAQGPCGSGTIPLAPVASFPAIPMSNQRGQLDADVGIPLPTSGEYHVNVYWGSSTDESDVFTCSALKMDRIK